MRRLVLSIISLFFMVLCNAQIAPPKQTDTLIITAVKYNFADIDRNNWPCEVIYKSTRDIRIGQQTFNVIEADKGWGTEVVFSVYDAEDNGKKEYELLFDDKGDGTFVLTFSGYEFRCYKKGNVVDEDVTVVDSAYGGPVIKSYNLEGRKASHLPIPAYRCYGEGEVTVIISVNQAGQVVKAEIKDDISSTDECLRSFAVRAARLSRFSAVSNANSIELGEIVYEFKSTGTSVTNIGYCAEPNAKLSGRSVNGTLPKPVSNIQTSGKVVVDIWVDTYGNVQKAVAGTEGTTVTDKKLWQAARKAALGAHFNMSADAPALQKGTITYVFTM